ncbi:MAG: glutathione peroxidase [Acholeplasma sp.]|jgi:glutathione peroxidase|nr:glutathione peroxidase [Acholeplasma sp.]
MKLYDLSVKNAKEELVSLSKYKGKVILIFNSATKCGYTNQYEGLEALYEQYQKQGLEILDFPSNQFMNQAPGSNEELSNFCKLKFGTKFETFAKVDVNGDDASPLFQYLRKTIKGDYPTEGSLINRLFRRNDKIKWNFTKFLIDREGNVIKRFAPSFKPEDIEPFIKAVL